jgi:hypothetical protein
MVWCLGKYRENLSFTFTFYQTTIRVLGFDFWWGLGIFLFATTSRTALGPSQLLIQWVPGSLSLGVKRPGREAGHSPPSSAKAKE